MRASVSRLGKIPRLSEANRHESLLIEAGKKNYCRTKPKFIIGRHISRYVILPDEVSAIFRRIQ